MKYRIDESEVRVYLKLNSCVFKKNNEEFGGLSNMATNFPLYVNDVHIRTTEALYQACRFPYNPEIQKRIIQEPSPMKVKMLSNANKKLTRADWEDVRLKIMRWCLTIKFAQNILSFGEVLNQTGLKHIVENSSKDNFWGAIPEDNGTIFKGKNALGRLLMELRQRVQSKTWIDLLIIEPPTVKEFLLFSQPLEIIDERSNFIQSLVKYWNREEKAPNETLEVYNNINQNQKFSSNLGLDFRADQTNLF